jgi:adenylate cyclase
MKSASQFREDGALTADGRLMRDKLRLRVLEDERTVFEICLDRVLLLGRQRRGEPGPYAVVSPTDGEPARVIIARHDEDNCGRKHVRLEPLADGRVLVANGSRIPLDVAGWTAAIDPGAEAEVTCPFAMSVGCRILAVSEGDAPDALGVQALGGKTIAPGELWAPGSEPRGRLSLSGPVLDEVIAWFQSTVSSLQSVAGSAAFLAEAASALVRVVGLQSGRVLLRHGEGWQVVAAAGARVADEKWQASRQVLERVCAERRTFLRPAGPGGPDAVQEVVASPLLDSDDRVVGVLYGERHRADPAPLFHPRVEAVLVETLACGVAAALARKKHEEAALRANLQFEQFFGQELARRLNEDPKLLEGRDAEVTLLFCDIRGFSRMAIAIGPGGTARWINDVMGTLSRCVLDTGGTVVDYIGDELFAMWGAPQPQADHALRAVAAACAMTKALAALNNRWQDTLKAPMNVGVGINTGQARVGNTGSDLRFKYGPLGNAVNLASRVQGVTKYLKCQVVATAATQQAMGNVYPSRRVCKARLADIDEAVDLYEVRDEVSAEKEAFLLSSEAALDALETGDFALAARRASSLLESNPRDGPLLLVLARASAMLVQGGTFDPVWQPPGK